MSAAVLDDGLVYEILSVVAEIPEGRVASYGQIAALIGRERNARLVGKVLSRAELYGDYPCHRVVNHAGRLAPHWPEQRAAGGRGRGHEGRGPCGHEALPLGAVKKHKKEASGLLFVMFPCWGWSPGWMCPDRACCPDGWRRPDPAPRA